MKLAIFFARPQGRRRRPARPAIDPTAAWSAREWADLPVHHPREG